MKPEELILKIESLNRLEELLSSDAWSEEIKPMVQSHMVNAEHRMLDTEVRGQDLEIARAEYLLARSILTYPESKRTTLQRQITKAKNAAPESLSIATEGKNVAEG
jgi:hypothetical protein